MKLKLKEYWTIFKALRKSREYFIVTSYQEDWVEPWRGLIKYEYLTNTDRELFYKFIQDYIDKLKKS